MHPEERNPPSLRILLPFGLVIAAADLFFWMLLGFMCGAYDNIEGAQARLCNHNDPQLRIHLPLLGAAVVLLSIYAARRYRRSWIFCAGALFALAAGAYLWAVINS